MNSILLLIVPTLLAGPAPSPNAPPTEAQVRAAVERSLPFLYKGAVAWKDRTFGAAKVRCVSCHQIPFAVWTHREAITRGIPVDDKAVEDLDAWMLDFCAKEKYRDEMVDAFLDTLAVVRAAGSRKDSDAALFIRFEQLLKEQQLKDGSWMEWDGNNKNEPGMQVVPKGSGDAAKREATEVDTMWTLLGLDALERQLVGPAAEPSRASLQKNRARALTWLAGAQGGKRSDWLAFRMLIERAHGDPAKVRAWHDKLLAQQNPDGGWGFAKGESSHPLATGQCLYALDEAAITAPPEVRQKARAFLLATQRPDGSWNAGSRVFVDHHNPVTIHWGTAWATLGLIRTLPHSGATTVVK